MPPTSMRLRDALSQQGRIDWPAVASWLLCVGLLVYLGLRGGGYDPLVHDQVGIAAWWIVLVGVLVGALPRSWPSPLAWAALGLLAGFVAWTALSLAWTESVERTAEQLALVATYLGVFALALAARRAGGGRRLVSAIATGIVIVAAIALLSRLHPAWFPDAGETARFLTSTKERLSYPIDYWNGLAALIAIGLPLLLQLATGAKTVLVRAAAAAAMPALTLTIFFTLSRGGMAAAVIALALYLALVPDRLPKLLTLLVTGAGGAILVAAATQRDALQDALLNGAARDQGDELLVITLAVCIVVGLLQAAVTVGLRDGRRPQWTRVSRQQSLLSVIAASIVALVVLVALDAPGRASEGWSEFKQGDGPGKGAGRLNSAAGQSRYQFWSSALRENGTKPLTGTGAGTFEYWWARDRDASDVVRDTHSLYFQTLGELGIVGLLLLLAFLLVLLVGGGRQALRASPDQRSLLSATLAACAAFCLTAAVDWMWQIPVLTVALLLLGSLLVSATPGPERPTAVALGSPARVVSCLLAAVAIAAIAIPLTSASLVRQSEAEAREGDLTGALEAARSAQNVQPSAASPRLQQALVLERLGDLEPAAEAARAATEREETNWRNWLVLSRIEARQGRAAAAVDAYRRARSLNPYSPLFDQ